MSEIMKAELDTAAALNRTPKNYRMFFTRDLNAARNIHAGRVNLPVGGEIAAVFIDDDGQPPSDVAVCVYPRHERGKHHIPFLHPSIDPLCFPLFFPHGESGKLLNYHVNQNRFNLLTSNIGWHMDLRHVAERQSRVYTRLTLRDFYLYRIACRERYDEEKREVVGWSSLHYGCKLFQQYVCQAWVRIEGNNLNFYRKNQQKLRVEQYAGLMDFIRNRNEVNNTIPGRLLILPSTHQVRNLFELKKKGQALNIAFRDLFVTWRNAIKTLWPW
jgi:hypothetical protein